MSTPSLRGPTQPRSAFVRRSRPGYGRPPDGIGPLSVENKGSATRGRTVACRWRGVDSIFVTALIISIIILDAVVFIVYALRSQKAKKKCRLSVCPLRPGKCSFPGAAQPPGPRHTQLVPLSSVRGQRTAYPPQNATQ